MMTPRDLQAAYPTVNLGQAVNPLPDFNFVYITNPKAGCSSAKLMLQRLHLGQPEYQPDVRAIHDLPVLPRPRDFGWTRMMQMLSGAAYVATFVRDPVRRAVSAYVDKIQGTPQDAGFDAFLDLIESQPPAEADQHWRPQHINIMHSAITYNRIGRVERFAEDWALIAQEAGLPPLPPMQSNRTGSWGQIQLRADQTARLRRIYADDIAAFGY